MGSEWLETATLSAPEALIGEGKTIDFILSVNEHIAEAAGNSAMLRDLEGVLKRLVQSDLADELLSAEVEGQTFIDHLRGSLDSGHIPLRAAAYAIFSALASTNKGQGRLLGSDSCVTGLVSGLGSGEVSVSQTSRAALTHLSRGGHGGAILQHPGLREVADTTPEAALRVVELVLDLCVLDPSCLHDAERLGWIGELTQLISTNEDILVRLNAVEVLNSHAVSATPARPGSEQLIRHIFEHHDLTPTILAFSDPASEAFDGFVGPHLLRLGGLAVRLPTEGSALLPLLHRSGYPALIDRLLNEPPSELTEAAVYCAGDLGLAMPDINHAMEALTQAVRGSSPGMRMASVRALGKLIVLVTEDLGLLILRGMGSRQKSAVEHLIWLTRGGDAQLCYAVYAFIEACVTIPWAGVHIFRSDPRTLCNWLVDSTTDITKTGKEWKHQIVGRAIRSEGILSVLSPEHVAQLKGFFALGPFRAASKPILS